MQRRSKRFPIGTDTFQRVEISSVQIERSPGYGRGRPQEEIFKACAAIGNASLL